MFWIVFLVMDFNRRKHVLTCSVGVVVALQPGLHTNQIMLIHKEDEILCKVNLIF